MRNIGSIVIGLALVLALIVLVVVALVPPVKASESMCDVLSPLAHTVMTNRQEGASLADTYRVCSSTDIESLRKLCQALAVDAYSSPVYQSERYKAEAATEFSNGVFLSCKAAEGSS